VLSLVQSRFSILLIVWCAAPSAAQCTARARLSSPLTSSPTPRSVYGIFILTIYFAGYCFVPHALIYRQLSIGLIWLCGYIQKRAKWRKLFTAATKHVSRTLHMFPESISHQRSSMHARPLFRKAKSRGASYFLLWERWIAGEKGHFVLCDVQHYN